MSCNCVICRELTFRHVLWDYLRNQRRLLKFISASAVLRWRAPRCKVWGRAQILTHYAPLPYLQGYHLVKDTPHASRSHDYMERIYDNTVCTALVPCVNLQHGDDNDDQLTDLLTLGYGRNLNKAGKTPLLVPFPSWGPLARACLLIYFL